MGSRQDGQFVRTKHGWSIRWYDHSGRRRQRGTFPTKTEARAVLDEELKRVRLGGSYQPKLTLNELAARYLEQYDKAPATRQWLSYFLGFAQAEFGDQLISRIDAHQIGAWRARLRTDHEKHGALRALRQVMAAAERWGWIDKNPARLTPNDGARPATFHPFDSWTQIDAIVNEFGDDHVSAALVATGVGTGLRLEELFALRWSSVDLDARRVLVERAYAKGVMKAYTKTGRRTVPLRSRVVNALAPLGGASSDLVFPALRGGPINLNNWRRRDWTDVQDAAGITPRRRPYDMRHTYATWSIAAGVNLFALSRRMGTSLSQVDRTYGHLMGDADDVERHLLDTWDQEAS